MTDKKSLFNLIFPLFALLSVALLTASCDDGHVDDEIHVYDTETYNVLLTGNFSKVNTWSGDYSLAVCGFSETSEYATIAKSMSNADGLTTIKLTNIPAETKTIEIAVINSLRKRVATLYQYEVSEDDEINDTIEVNVGDMNVGMFALINNNLFQGSKTSCSKCHSPHGTSAAAAGLDLSADKAYQNLVGIASTKSPANLRVKAGDAENSFLYKVLSTGDNNVHYSHLQLMTDEQTLLDVLKQWIDGGAKE